MQMLNPYCGVDRDPRGVVRLTICNAGSLNILGSAVINGVREGLELLATDRQIRVLVIAGQSEKSMIGGADIKEMAKLDQASAEKFITGLRDLCEAVRAFPAPVIARMPGWCLGGGLEVAAACDFRIAADDAKFGCRGRTYRGCPAGMQSGGLAFAESPAQTMGRTAADGIRQPQHRRVWAIVPDRRAAAADAGFCQSEAVATKAVMPRACGASSTP